MRPDLHPFLILVFQRPNLPISDEVISAVAAFDMATVYGTLLVDDATVVIEADRASARWRQAASNDASFFR